MEEENVDPLRVSKGLLLMDRAMLTHGKRQELYAVGYDVVGIHDVNGVRQVPEVGPVMTLRQRYALAALPGIIQVCAQDPRDKGVSIEQYFARRALACADALIKEGS